MYRLQASPTCTYHTLVRCQWCSTLHNDSGSHERKLLSACEWSGFADQRLSLNDAVQAITKLRMSKSNDFGDITVCLGMSGV